VRPAAKSNGSAAPHNKAVDADPKRASSTGHGEHPSKPDKPARPSALPANIVQSLARLAGTPSPQSVANDKSSDGDNEKRDRTPPRKLKAGE
jgi:hypothetical protein